MVPISKKPMLLSGWIRIYAQDPEGGRGGGGDNVQGLQNVPHLTEWLK